MMIAVDTETTGKDFRHGALPFLVTVCDEEGQQTCWEWDVNPLDRMPDIPIDHVARIKESLTLQSNWRHFDSETLERHVIVGQNIKFDTCALQKIGVVKEVEDWPWDITRDTLIASHLLASGKHHDLTSLALMYLGVNILPYEQRLKEAVMKARSYCRSHLKHWRIAKAGLPEMPSAKVSKSSPGKNDPLWKMDSWLPKALATYLWESLEQGPEHRYAEPVKPVADQEQQWLFQSTSTSKKGTTNKGVDKLVKDIGIGSLSDFKPPNSDNDSPNSLNCHPWYTVCSEYANQDSAVTIAIWQVMKQELHRRGLWEIFLERMRIVPIIADMEERGVTISGERLNKVKGEYVQRSEGLERTLVNIARTYNYPLSVPNGSANNQSLHSFVFTNRGMSIEPFKETESGLAALDKASMEHFLVISEDNSREKVFFESLIELRARRKALGDMEGYSRFWRPYFNNRDRKIQACFGPLKHDGTDLFNEWYTLFPQLNPTGTAHLRMSSQNPNEQNISKRQGYNMRLAFGPAPGREWWSLDAKNIEARIPAYEAEEEVLIVLYEKPKEAPFYGSTHLLNFSVVYPDLWSKELGSICNEDNCCKGKRVDESLIGPHCKRKFEATWYQWIKNAWFAIQYGAQQPTVDATAKRKGAYQAIWGRLGKLSALNRKWIAYAEKHGYIETIPDKLVNPKRGYPIECTRTEAGTILPTVPLNYHTSGTACWWMQAAMIEVEKDHLKPWRKQQFNAYTTMNIHDELVFDLPYAPKVKNPDWLKLSDEDKAKSKIKEMIPGNLPRMRQIQQTMEKIGDRIGIPTPVSIGYNERNWKDEEEY